MISIYWVAVENLPYCIGCYILDAKDPHPNNICVQSKIFDYDGYHIHLRKGYQL